MNPSRSPAQNDFDLDLAIENWSRGTTLPRQFFTSAEVFELDVERVHFRHWLFAGHASRISKPGDFFRYDIAGESLLIVRDQSGRARAFFNVCRHRGSQLCKQEFGTVRQFVCPYHAWSYGTDGGLRAARHLPPTVDKSQLALHAAHVVEVEALLFVCLAESPPDLRSVTDDLTQFFSPHRLADAKICHRTSYRIQANWKIVTENFWECYHCGPAHPELEQVMGYVRAADSKRAQQQYDAYVAKWEQDTASRGFVTGSSTSETGLCEHTVRIPIREGFVTQSRGGQPVAPLMGDYQEYDGGVTAIQFFPLNWIVACNDHAMLSRFTPVSPQTTEVEITWLVDGNAREGEDYSVEDVTWLWAKTVEQDAWLCENNQRGVNSRRYQPGPYSTMENAAAGFVDWYLTQLRQEE